MGANGTREAEEQDLEEFRALHPAEQRVRHYQISRSTNVSTTETFDAIGALTKEVARNTEALRDQTLAERQSAIALRAFTEAFVGAREALPKPPTKPLSIPPARLPLPSLLQERDDDDTKVRKVKTAALERIIAEREESDAALAYVSRWGSRLKTAGALVGALLVIGGFVVGIIAYARAHWH